MNGSIAAHYSHDVEVDGLTKMRFRVLEEAIRAPLDTRKTLASVLKKNQRKRTSSVIWMESLTSVVAIQEYPLLFPNLTSSRDLLSFAHTSKDLNPIERNTRVTSTLIL